MQKSKKVLKVRKDLSGAGAAGVAEGAGAKGEVGRMVDSGQADDRRLIRLVRDRRLLYARNNMPVASYYAQVKRLWQQVAAEMGWDVADVRRKWSHIRNSYSRHLRNEMHGACTSKGRMVSKWYLADELEFLRDHMATDTRSAPYPTFASSFLDMDITETQKPDPVDVKPFVSNPWFSLNSPPLSFEQKAVSEDSSSSHNFAPDENSSFFQFFRGLYGDYQELSASSRRAFKRQCLGFLHSLLDDEEHSRSAREPADALNLSQSVLASDDEREHKVFDADPGAGDRPPLAPGDQPPLARGDKALANMVVVKLPNEPAPFPPS